MSSYELIATTRTTHAIAHVGQWRQRLTGLDEVRNILDRRPELRTMPDGE